MKSFNKIRIMSLSLACMLSILISAPVSVSAAQATVNLGSTVNFAVLAGSTITNTGSTTIGGTFGGDVGLHPGTSVTGFPPGTIGGTLHQTDTTAELAKADLVIAYDDAKNRSVTMDLSGQDLGGMTLTTGVYFFSTSAQLTGTLTLDAQGDPNAVFIFQIGSTLTTATNSVVSLINGARFCRVFWQVTSSATLGTSTRFVGHILALQSITVNTTASVEGQLLARNGAVTLDSNTILNGLCATVTPTPTPTPTSTTTATPTPTTGGTLPDTSTPWHTFLVIGIVFVLAGGTIFIKSKKVS